MVRIDARTVLVSRGYPTPCRIWTGYVAPNGYGCIAILRADGVKTNRGVHRVAWEHLKGPVPEGLQLDHLCRQRDCWEPSHIELVTGSENTKRGLTPILNRIRSAGITHCKSGHEFTPENTYYWRSAEGYACRACRACRVVRNRAYIQRKRAAA